MARQRAIAISVLVVCANLVSTNKAFAAALTAADVSPAEVTQITQAASASVAIGKALKTLTLTDVDVREVRETTGLLATFRIGRLTHCLSTVLQCGGKAYSVSAP